MDTKICPQCNTENPIAANFCRKCRYEFPEETKNGHSLTPQIKSFAIIENEYVVGSTIHLRWDVENFTSLDLNGEDVTSYSDAEIIVDKPTTIKLIARNDYDQFSATVSIIPKKIPRIMKFSSNFQKVRPNQKFKLAWSIDHPSKVFLNNGETDIDVTGRFTYELTATEDTLYTLKCATVDPDIFVERQIKVTVVSEAIIKEFRSDSNFIIESEGITLSWVVKNADETILYPNHIDVTGKDSIQLYPNRTTEYRLICRNSISECQESVSVCVKPLPKIDLNFEEAMGNLSIPTCNLQMESILPDVRQINIERFLSGEITDSIEQTLSHRSIFNKVGKYLSHRLKI